MLGFHPSTIGISVSLADAKPVVNSLAVLVLCVIAGIGTVLLLPSHYHPNWRKLGGAILGAAGLMFMALVLRHEALVHQTSLHTAYFWIFAAISLFGAVRVVTHRRPVYSALYFVLTVFATSGLFVLLRADFMAAALVIIYAGAILITYVFVIMLAVQPSDGASASQQMVDYDNRSRDPFIASAIGFALMGVLLLVIFDRPEGLTPGGPLNIGVINPPAGAPALEGNTQQLGVYLFGYQQISLELAGLMLTIAMVGAIVIARRRVLHTDAGPAGPVETVVFPATPVDDNPHSIPVYGTDNPNQKAYPET
ncbi:MAG TPA: NADH-quinone oxidoreductase subunit J [Tepidisphaeraceae bacterium]|jgi:NADH-quinone oxidoreductase subunit J